MPEGGDFCFIFRPGDWSFALKSCPRVGILTEKISDPGKIMRFTVILSVVLPMMLLKND